MGRTLCLFEANFYMVQVHSLYVPRSFLTQQAQQPSLRIHPVIAKSLHAPTNVDVPAPFRVNPRLLMQKVDPL